MKLESKFTLGMNTPYPKVITKLLNMESVLLMRLVSLRLVNHGAVCSWPYMLKCSWSKVQILPFMMQAFITLLMWCISELNKMENFPDVIPTHINIQLAWKIH